MRMYLFRFTPPRPTTFQSDMTAAETNALRAHAAYWQSLADRGKVLVFGPVADPEGAYGIAVITAADYEDVRPLAEGDPAVGSGLGFSYTLHPMPKFGLPSHLRR